MKYRSLVLLVVVLAVGAMAVRPSFDGDTWWHLRAGQWILDHGRVPTTDPFSSTMAGRPWVYPGWLAEVMLVAFDKAGGLNGLTLFTALFVSIAMVFLWRILEGPLVVRAAVLLLAAAASAVYWAARPHVLTLALAAVTLWVLEQGVRRGRLRWLWAMPPLLALWANLHGGFAVGLLLLGVAVLAAAIASVAGRRAGSDGSRRVWTLVAVTLASVAAVSLNPHGPVILLYPFKTVSIPVLQEHILEWQPPDFRQPQLLPLLGLMLAYAASLVLGRRRVTAFELLSGGGWAALALTAVRHAPIFALAAAPVVSRHLGQALESRLDRSVEQLPGTAGRRRLHLAAGAALTVAAVGWGALQLGPATVQAHLQAQAPVEAVAFLRQAHPAPNLFNDYNWGGYVLWTLYPDYPTFVDGRTDVFSAAVFEDYLRFWTAAPGWPSVAERHAIRAVLVPPEAPIVPALRASGWREVFRDGQAVVLEASEAG